MPYFFMQCISWDEKLRRLSGDSPTPELEEGAFTDGERIEKRLTKKLVWNLLPGRGEIPVFFKTPAFVVRKDFADALKEGGVDNIDYYELTLRDLETGQTWNTHLVANVIGVVDAIDMEASEVSSDSPPETAVLFDKIVISEQKCRGLKIFRPRHKQTSLLVSQELRDFIEARHFKHVEFVDPEDYA